MRLSNIIKIIILNDKMTPEEIKIELINKYKEHISDETKLLERILGTIKNSDSFFHDEKDDSVSLTNKGIIIDKKLYYVKNFVEIKKNYNYLWKYIISVMVVSITFSLIVFKLNAIIPTIIVVVIHSIPLLFSIETVKILNDLDKNITFGVFLIIISLLPLAVALIILYEGLTCGSGCFSGLFFMLSVIPTFILIVFIIVVNRIILK